MTPRYRRLNVLSLARLGVADCAMRTTAGDARETTVLAGLFTFQDY